MFPFILFSDSATALRWRAYALGLLNTGWTSTALFLQAALHARSTLTTRRAVGVGIPTRAARRPRTLLSATCVFAAANLQLNLQCVRASHVLVLKINIGRNVYSYFEADKCKAGMISYHTSDNSAAWSDD